MLETLSTKDRALLERALQRHQRRSARDHRIVNWTLDSDAFPFVFTLILLLLAVFSSWEFHRTLHHRLASIPLEHRQQFDAFEQRVKAKHLSCEQELAGCWNALREFRETEKRVVPEMLEVWSRLTFPLMRWHDAAGLCLLGFVLAMTLGLMGRYRRLSLRLYQELKAKEGAG